MIVPGAGRAAQAGALARSPQDCDAAQDMLGESVAVYLDADPTATAVPSSIVDLTGEVPVLLRAGAVGADRLRELLPDLGER